MHDIVTSHYHENLNYENRYLIKKIIAEEKVQLTFKTTNRKVIRPLNQLRRYDYICERPNKNNIFKLVI